MLLIKNGRVMNPATGMDEVTDVWWKMEKLPGRGAGHGHGTGRL